jgi:hypothetical protein
MQRSDLPSEEDLGRFEAVVRVMRALHVRRWGDIELDDVAQAAPEESAEAKRERDLRLARDAEHRRRVVQFAHSKVRPR